MGSLILFGMALLELLKVRSNNTFILENLDGETLQLPVNGQYLKHYFQF